MGPAGGLAATRRSQAGVDGATDEEDEDRVKNRNIHGGASGVLLFDYNVIESHRVNVKL